MVVQHKTPENIRQWSNLLDQLSVGGGATRSFLGIFVASWCEPKVQMGSRERFSSSPTESPLNRSIHPTIQTCFLTLLKVYFSAVGSLPFKIFGPASVPQSLVGFCRGGTRWVCFVSCSATKVLRRKSVSWSDGIGHAVGGRDPAPPGT